MQSQASNVLPFVRMANAAERQFPLRFRIDGTTATSYFETDEARSQKARSACQFPRGCCVPAVEFVIRSTDLTVAPIF
jgi:hypothetical protein